MTIPTPIQPPSRVAFGNPAAPNAALAFGVWAAVDCGGRAWRVGHIPTGLFTGDYCHQDLALACARLLHERLPDWQFDADPAGPALTALRAVAPGVLADALATLPLVEARPFTVAIYRRVEIVVLAQDSDAAACAVRTLCAREREDLLDGAELQVDRPFDDGAAGAAHGAGIAFIGRGEDAELDDRGRMFHAVDGCLYRPGLAPARVHLRPEPDRDHDHRCPARPRASALGQADPGPCTCLARAFPAPPPAEPRAAPATPEGSP